VRRAALRPRARRDLEDIWDHTAKTWGPAQAEIYLRQIETSLATIAQEPMIGRACDEIRAGYRKFPAGSHIVFYRIDADTIDVVRILHQRMDIDRHL
jgi:toxin ParE1/3/4